jgi:aminoglycoside phosphotransferase (APT) family kinase protein
MDLSVSNGPPQTPNTGERLAAWLSEALAAEVTVAALEPLSGGAIQDNRAVTARVDGVSRRYVLRKNAPASLSFSHDRRLEFALVRAAKAAGVAVPEPVAFCEDASVIGEPFALYGFVEGVALGPRVVRDEALEPARRGIARQAGAQMAKIHAVRPPHRDLAGLPPPPDDRAIADVAILRGSLDDAGIERPVLEWGLRWAEATSPPPRGPVLIHRDFRTGNYLVGPEGIAAVLDWEFADWGDPMVDLGWFCAACWRFGREDREAGGVGHRQDLYEGYEAAGGTAVDDAAVRYWEVMAHIRWAVIALEQGRRHTSGREPSLELALTARIVPELELAIIRATAPNRWRRRGEG